MVEVGLAPGYTSALGGGHVFGALGATPPGTVPSGAPFPFAGISNTPGGAVPASSPIQTAAPKTNVGIPYARNVPSVFAQQKNNLATAEVGDPVFVSAQTPISWRSAGVGTMRFTNLATVEYLNDQLEATKNVRDANQAAGADMLAARKALAGNLKKRKLDELDLQIERAEDTKENGVQKLKAQVVQELKEKKDDAVDAFDGLANGANFNPNYDFLALPAFKEWKLDGMIRSVDIDGNPRLMTQDGRPTIANTSEVSVSALVNVIVAGPARARVIDGVGYDRKFTYAPQNQKLARRANVFDQLVLAVVKGEKDGKTSFKVVRSTRSYETNTKPALDNGAAGDGRIVRDGVGPAMVRFDGVEKDDEANIVGYWRLGRCVEEPSSTDRACGIVFTGNFVLCQKDDTVPGGFTETEL